MSEYSQFSFIGGMNLLIDDTRLADNQYRCGLNVRNRYDTLSLVANSIQDQGAPTGIKQEIVTFGNYIIMFVSGKCYYKYYTDSNWTLLSAFSMSPDAPRYWTCEVPVSCTNYIRIANPSSQLISGQGLTALYNSSANSGIQLLTLEGASEGNLPGLLVQDNLNQPQFIFLDDDNIPQCRTTQTYDQWMIGYTDATNTVVGPKGGPADITGKYDLREYVPVGNCMAWANGILFIVGQDFTSIFRSVSGRPLDFVVNVTNNLTNAYATINGLTSYWQFGGGDATTTDYSVGVSGISCIRPISTGGIFVSASNANFAVTLNTNANAPTEFGEYTFIRQFLFNATNLSDRTIIDSLGDTKFIDLVGIRSFNAVEQLNNEGRNSVFSSTIQKALMQNVGGVISNIVQDSDNCAAILYDNYELYAINTSLGQVIAVYDTINSCWSSFDTTQTNGKPIKAFAKIELTVQALYAITEDDNLYQLYCGTTNAEAYVRTNAVNYSIRSQYTGLTVRLNDPKVAIKPQRIRFTMSEINENCSFTATPFINDNQSKLGPQVKKINYIPAKYPYKGPIQLIDTDTGVYNGLFNLPNCEQGWDWFLVLSWTNGTLIQYSLFHQDLTPENPMGAQSNAAYESATIQ